MTETKTETCTQCECPDAGDHWDWCSTLGDAAGTPTRNEQAALLVVAIHDMAEKLSDSYTSCEQGPGFTCNEADALASVLAYSGHVEAAARWVLGHASGDDEGDQHAGIHTYERALTYIRHMWGMEAA